MEEHLDSGLTVQKPRQDTIHACITHRRSPLATLSYYYGLFECTCKSGGGIYRTAFEMSEES